MFERLIKVRDSDLDELNHVNNVVYLQWVQDIASAHWREIAPRGFDRDYQWVVLKNTIEYKKPALLGDELILRTWVDTIDGVRSDRCVEIIKAANQTPVCAARTTWCLIDRATGRPRRIEGETELSLKKQ
jgi:acyl-CoA thioester hydrolase